MKGILRSPRHYSPRTVKVLWGRAAGRCAVPECRIDLIADATDYDPIVVIGDIAHIEASSEKGPRANRQLSANARDSYDNLILLCKNCHFRLDAQKKANSVAVIKQLRATHESWVRASLPECGRSTSGWRVLLLQGQYPIDPALTTAALSPDFPKGRPIILSIAPNAPWPVTFEKMRKVIHGWTGNRDSFDTRFALFPLVPVSACLAAGYLLTNRPRVRLFQHHRTTGIWTWPKHRIAPWDVKITGLPVKRDARKGEVVIRFHLSARIELADIPVSKNSLLRTVDVAVPEPSVHWLKSTNQLDALGDVATSLFAAVSQQLPNAARWHLLYAGPAPGGVKVGQQLNPTMSPPTQLYEFSRAATPRYRPSILLTPSEL